MRIKVVVLCLFLAATASAAKVVKIAVRGEHSAELLSYIQEFDNKKDLEFIEDMEAPEYQLMVETGRSGAIGAGAGSSAMVLDPENRPIIQLQVFERWTRKGAIKHLAKAFVRFVSKRGQ